MIGLVLALLGLGAFAVYELSPRTHQWVDDHVRAIDALLKAVRRAHANIDAAKVSPDTATAAEHARAAEAARAEAARQAVIAADTARTSEQQASVAQAFATINQIAAALGDLGAVALARA